MDIRTWHKPLLLVAALMIGSVVASAGGLLLDGRTVNGEPIWLKPVKFSVGIYSFSLAWLISALPGRQRFTRRLGTATMVVPAVEMVIIIGQVFRGKASHFNNSPISTPFCTSSWACRSACCGWSASSSPFSCCGSGSPSRPCCGPSASA